MGTPSETVGTGPVFSMRSNMPRLVSRFIMVLFIGDGGGVHPAGYRNAAVISVKTGRSSLANNAET